MVESEPAMTGSRPASGGGERALWCVALPAAFLCLLLGRFEIRAAEAPPNPDPVRLTREVERLQFELEKARSEIDRLRLENERLRLATPTAAGAAPAPTHHTPVLPAVPAPAATPALLSTPPALAAAPSSMPLLQEEDVVAVADVLGLFRADPVAAAGQCEGKVFRVEGEVDRFELPLLQRTYEVQLAAPDRLLAVSCRFSYVERYQKVFTQDRGRALVGRIDDRSVRPLLRAGDRVVIRGRCAGLKEGRVLFTGCSVVSREPASIPAR